METRIANLESSDKSEDKEADDKELEELKDLLPDIIAKVCLVIRRALVTNSFV